MYGHELYDEMKKIDGKLKACFLAATYLNYEDARHFPFLDWNASFKNP
jgi:hypothetical protein